MNKTVKLISFLLLGFLKFFTASGQLVVSEFNYQSDSTLNSGDLIEFWNTGTAPADLSGWKMVDGNILNPPYVIPQGTVIPAGGRLVFAENLTRFDQIHAGVTRIGPLGFEFSNQGEAITLQDAADLVKIQFTFDDSLPWNKCADGFGRTLELIDPAVSPGNPENWRCGCIKGSPGSAFSPCTTENLIISEINYRSPLQQISGDWFELWNRTNNSLNLSGYKFRDDNMVNLFTFPSGTFLNPQERIVIFNDAVNFNALYPNVNKKTGPFLFNLDGNGDAIRIYNSLDRLVQSVWYDDDGAWPKCADGNGYTLELDTAFAQPMDICSVGSWFCGCPGGSPGTSFINTCGLDAETIQKEIPFFIRPVPSEGIITLTSEIFPALLTLYSGDGKKVKTTSVSGAETSWDLSDLPRGFYYVQIQTEKGKTAVRKIILR
jgi:hypothetical protein